MEYLSKLLVIKDFFLKHKSKIFFRFLLSGFVNTLLGICITLLFLAFLPFHYSVSIFLGTCIGILSNYLMSLNYVFNTTSSTSRIFLYVMVYLIMYIANILLMSILISQFNLSDIISYLICAPFTISCTYILQKKIVFKLS